MPELSLEEKLDGYEALLKKWQRSINLVSRNTIDDARFRHIDDSLQVVQYVPNSAKVLFDFGSGAGFPGLVIAMARPDVKVSLVESDQRKCTFLYTVSRETSTPITVMNQRIESAALDSIPDVLSARALASLDKLFGFALPYADKNPDLVMLFMKGERADDEIEEAQENYSFEYEKIQSETEASACILRITNLSANSES
ncbi:MAG: 16S rRNA (guanine(527)-N(7))-methyltransferase RsmG [Pseudomonadota bacterium]|nr:16S rRNA (guanine(527)-N(7))-methyltransferase RsmG [Pseudomonadota bacterium]